MVCKWKMNMNHKRMNDIVHSVYHIRVTISSFHTRALKTILYNNLVKMNTWHEHIKR